MIDTITDRINRHSILINQNISKKKEHKNFDKKIIII